MVLRSTLNCLAMSSCLAFGFLLWYSHIRFRSTLYKRCFLCLRAAAGDDSGFGASVLPCDAETVEETVCAETTLVAGDAERG